MRITPIFIQALLLERTCNAVVATIDGDGQLRFQKFVPQNSKMTVAVNVKLETCVNVQSIHFVWEHSAEL